MIGLQLPPTIVEVPDPSLNYVITQVTVAAPEEMQQREATAWRVLQEVFMHGTESFSRDQILHFGGQAGIPPTLYAMPDHFSIQIAVPAGGIDVGFQLIESMLEEPHINAEDLNAAIARLRASERDAWHTALDPAAPAYDRVRVEDVVAVYTNAVQANLINVVVYGGFEPGKGIVEASWRFVDESFEQPTRRYPDIGPERVTKAPGTSAALILVTEPIDFSSPNSWSRLLATFALGVGKSGAMHRVVREELGLTYRQEAVLWGTSDGLVPKFVALRDVAPDELPAETIETIRAALLADIQEWDKATMDAAQGNARATFIEGSPFSPIQIAPNQPLGVEPADHAAWIGYMTMLGKRALADPKLIVEQLERVTIEELKKAATSLVTDADATVLPARGF